MRSWLAAAALSLAPSVTLADPPPPLVLWAWERPEDLRFLPDSVGVASLEATVDITPAGPRVATRRQPLLLRATQWRMAVVRVQTRRRGIALSPEVRRAVLDVVLRAAQREGVRGVQIDYDAVASQRAAYRELWGEVRRALGASRWLSMTALASWCVGDRWLDDAAMPVDEVVPMVFTMGRGGAPVLDVLRGRREFPSPACRTSVGWAVGEPAVSLRGARRVYMFNARPWQPADAEPLLREVTASPATRRSGAR